MSDSKVVPMNYQGARLLGTDFATNYGQEIRGCFQFMFHGYEISVSSGAYDSTRPRQSFPEPVLITHPDGNSTQINGTVHDAIIFVMAEKSNLPEFLR